MLAPPVRRVVERLTRRLPEVLRRPVVRLDLLFRFVSHGHAVIVHLLEDRYIHKYSDFLMRTVGGRSAVQNSTLLVALNRCVAVVIGSTMVLVYWVAMPRAEKDTTRVTRERWLADGKAVELRCLACGLWIPLYATQRGKPHGFCTGCGFQVFFRMKASLDALSAFIAAKRWDIVRIESDTADKPRGDATIDVPASSAGIQQQ